MSNDISEIKLNILEMKCEIDRLNSNDKAIKETLKQLTLIAIDIISDIHGENAVSQKLKERLNDPI